VSTVKYKLGFYIPEDDILHSDRRETLKSYMALLVDNLTDCISEDNYVVRVSTIFLC
jgi:hypothetical protein